VLRAGRRAQLLLARPKGKRVAKEAKVENKALKVKSKKTKVKEYSKTNN
jgi:hypothetical protein